jgi:hypothetical protein
MGIIYLRCDLICSSSTLALVLRANSTIPGPVNYASEECVAVARDVLDIHQQCMVGVRSSKGAISMLQKYINW